jgi:hypothetical protein
MDFTMTDYKNIRDNKLRNMHSHYSITEDGSNKSYNHIFY